MPEAKPFSRQAADWMSDDISTARKATAPTRPFATPPFFAETLKVISGDFRKSEASAKKEHLYMPVTWCQYVKYHLSEIAKIEIVGADQGQANAVGAAMIGGLLLGGAGLVAGAVAGKRSQVHFAVTFRDGKRALLSCQADVYARIKFEHDGLTPPEIPQNTTDVLSERINRFV